MGFNLLPFDAELCTYTHLEMTGGTRPAGIIEFQFPPIIKSDSKMLNFEEKDLTNIEPVAVFKGARARDIELKWTYVITGGYWNIDKISHIVKSIRGYMYTSMLTAFAKGNQMIVQFRSGDVVGAGFSTFSFRPDGINVSYSDVMVREQGIQLKTPLGTRTAAASTNQYIEEPPGGGYVSPPSPNESPDRVFPLRTDLCMRLKLWSLGEDSEGKRMMSLPGLRSVANLTPDWY